MIPKSSCRFSEKIMLKEKAKGGAQRCAACRFFTDAPAALERALPGLNNLSSAYGSVRADTGLCQRQDVFVTARSPACEQFDERTDPSR
jgi:hypothetical protein